MRRQGRTQVCVSISLLEQAFCQRVGGCFFFGGSTSRITPTLGNLLDVSDQTVPPAFLLLGELV